MPDRYDAKIGDAVDLQISFELDDEAFDPYEVKQVIITDGDGTIIDTITTVSKVTAGLYEVTTSEFLQAGTFCDSWYYTSVEDAEQRVKQLEFTVEDVSAEEGETPTPTTDTPTAGADQVCLVTHTFYDAGGEPRQGVRVKFDPEMHTDTKSSLGFVVAPVTGESDKNGLLSMYIMRGISGLIVVGDLGLVRRVTIPDVGAINLKDLTASGIDDPLEVQTIDLISLPRRS